MRKTTQKQWILNQLKKGKKVTPLDSLDGCGCFRMAAIIFELREEGYLIETIRQHSLGGANYAGYKLIKAGTK